MNLLKSTINSFSISATDVHNTTKKFYQWTYISQPRAVEKPEAIIEEKCLQMRTVLGVMSKLPKDIDSESLMLVLSIDLALTKLFPSRAIETEDAYQQGLSILAANCNSEGSPFRLMLIAKNEFYGIVNYVKNCPNLFFNDLIQEIVLSMLSIKDKLYAIDKILNCYHKYVNDTLALYALAIDDTPNLSPSFEERLFDILKLKEFPGQNIPEKFAVEQLEKLLQSYKIALGHLFGLSKDYSWKEWFSNLGHSFYLKYSIEHIITPLKLLSVLPDSDFKNRLSMAVVNYFTFIRFNKSLDFIVYLIPSLFLVLGTTAWGYAVSMPIALSIVSITSLAVNGFSSLPFSVKGHEFAKSIVSFNNKTLLPLICIAAVVLNFYLLINGIYSSFSKLTTT